MVNIVFTLDSVSMIAIFEEVKQVPSALYASFRVATIIWHSKGNSSRLLFRMNTAWGSSQMLNGVEKKDLEYHPCSNLWTSITSRLLLHSIKVFGWCPLRQFQPPVQSQDCISITVLGQYLHYLKYYFHFKLNSHYWYLVHHCHLKNLPFSVCSYL